MKFEIGDLVYIKKELPNYMSHFECDMYTLITDIKDDDLYGTTISSWYPSSTLKLIKRNPNIKLLKILESTKED